MQRMDRTTVRCNICIRRNALWYNVITADANGGARKRTIDERNGKLRATHSPFPPRFQIQAAANLLLESKMFYVPFVLNSAEIR